MKTKTNLRTAFITFCQLPIAYCLLLIVYCLLPTASFAQVANGTGAGNCLSYDGVSNNRVEMGAGIGSLDPDYVTFEAWVNPASDNIGQPVFQKKNCGYGGWISYGIFISTSEVTVKVQQNGAPGFIFFTTPTNLLTKNQWNHLAFTFGTDYIVRLYVNGTLLTTSSAGTNPIYYYSRNHPAFIGVDAYNTAAMCGGVHDGYNSPFQGKIDEIRIWNRALTQTEIQQNMCQKLRGNEAGLVGYWRFDEGNGTTAFDASPNGNNGTLR